MLTNIETERVRKGLTQEQLASQLGVSHKTYYNWINEKKDIPSQKLKKMSRKGVKDEAKDTEKEI